MNELPKKLQDVISAIFKEIKPKPRTNTLEFAKKRGFLSPESSAIVGRFVPFAYQEDILRDTSDDDIEMLVWMKSTRVGYTKLVNFSVAYNIAEDPCPQLIFQPNDSKAGEWSKKELKPMLRDMRYVGDRILKTREDDNLNFKAYPGGFLESRGGKSANNYASATAKKVYFDEYDRFPDDVDGEGDPYELGVKRIESYWNGGVFIGSTPTVTGKSKTEAKFNETDMKFRYLPCPHCNHYQILDFKNLVWDKEYREGVMTHLTDTTKLLCINCSEKIEHKEKKKMDAKGRWRQTQPFFCCDKWQDPKTNENWFRNPDDKYDVRNGEALCVECNATAEYNRIGRKKRGYHIWAGYSFQPNTTWSKIAETFVKAIGSTDKMRVFKNTWLGETFEEKTVRLHSKDLVDKIDHYSKVPSDAKVVIMTVDTQNDRLEYLIKAWSAGETSHNIEAGKIMGDPVNQKVWDELYQKAITKIPMEGGQDVTIFKSFIDMGGGRTDEVKKFVRKHSDKFIMVKGDDKENKHNDTRPIATLKISEKDKDKIVWVATTKAKDIIFERLALQRGDNGFIHHNSTFDEEWFEQLTAEKKVFKKNKRGFIEATYIKTRDRNEAIDLEVYNLAAIKLIQAEIPGFDLSIKKD